MKKNYFTQTEETYFELLCQRINDAGVNIAHTYDEYLRFACVCSLYGETGRQWFHRLCAFDGKYDAKKCDEQFDNCLKSSRHEITLGTLVEMARSNGVDVKKPKGRPSKSEAQKDEEHKAVFEQVREFLHREFDFRYNILSERIEVKENEGEWHDFDDRALNTILTKLHSSNVRVSKDNLSTYVNSGCFSTPYNPVNEYVKSLKPWNRRTDYIAKVFGHLHLEKGSDVKTQLEGFKLWLVNLLACALELDVVNQLILVLAGEKEGTGKTEFILRLLPPSLRQYLHNATQLSSFKDKDEPLAMAHNILFFLDEIQLNRQTFNKLKNMVGGAGAKTVTERAPFAHNATVRKVHASMAATTNHIDFLPEDLGTRRVLVLPVVGSDNYDNLPIDKAFAQAYYLATHPHKFSTKISPELIARLKEINRKYVNEDICSAIIPTVLRQPKEGEKAQAVLSGEIIEWMTAKTGMNREYNARNVNAAMRKMGFVPTKSNKGNVYVVKRIMHDELTREGESLAIDILNPESH